MLSPMSTRLPVVDLVIPSGPGHWLFPVPTLRMLAPMQRAYSQIKVRDGRVPLSSKIFQGFGSIPDSHIQFAFNGLLLLYYNQVLGISATSVAIALAISILIDAITDPLVGAFSDRLKSRLGRRHTANVPWRCTIGCDDVLPVLTPFFLTNSQLVGWLFLSVIG